MALRAVAHLRHDTPWGSEVNYRPTHAIRTDTSLGVLLIAKT
jgi:hypothetical protein